MYRLVIVFVLLLVSACSADKPERQYADMAFTNAVVYTVEGPSTTAEALASRAGRIVYVGSSEGLASWIGPNTRVIDLAGKTVTPGFIESHAHLRGLGHSLQILQLASLNNYEAMVALVAAAVESTPKGEWILGRGWHQSKWDRVPSPQVKGFQTHHALSAVSPDNPVMLGHASGHAVFVNAKAMELAGITADTVFSGDGEIIKDEHGEPTGILNENAAYLVQKLVADLTMEQRKKQIERGMEESLRWGITSFHDAGVTSGDIEAMQALGREGRLTVRLYPMLSSADPALIEAFMQSGPMISAFDDYLTVRSIKVHADGALGSRGAWLHEDYLDRPGHRGMPTYPMDGVLQLAQRSLERGFQLNVHAIGDRTNTEVLDRFQAALDANPVSDHRFRIEHAQHLRESDIPRFAELGVIAAMQAIHMGSDRPWAIKRLGKERIEAGAYVWQKLLQSGARVINGTDAPVEPISPLASFYASVSRKTLAGEPDGGYEASQRMSRAQALRSYTLDAAFGEFGESVKGSLEVGKYTDLTVFDRDIMTIPENEILSAKIAMTVVGGVVRYQAGGG